jgi:hypothetical protein
MKKIILITFTIFFTLSFTSCSINDNETLEEFEIIQATGGDDEGEILPPPPNKKEGNLEKHLQNKV